MSIQPPPPPLGGIPSMPAAQWGPPPVQGPPPSTVLNASKLIFVQVGLSVLSLVVTLATTGSIKDQIRDASPTLDQSAIDVAAGIAIGVSVVFGIIGIALWTLLAVKVRAGKNWARIVTFVFAGLGLASALFSIAQPASVLGHVLLLVDAVIDVTLIVLLTRPASVAFFQRRPVVAG